MVEINLLDATIKQIDPIMNTAERATLEAIKKKDKGSFEALFRQFYRPLVMFASQYLDSIQEAEDLVQDVFIKLWERDSLQKVNTKLYAYLYRSVKNACLNKLEKDKQGTIISLGEIPDSIDEEQTFDEEKWNHYLEKVYEEIENLPLRTKEIFKAIVIEKRKYKDVSQELDISVNTIKTTLSRALTKLRTSFTDDEISLFLVLCICSRILK